MLPSTDPLIRKLRPKIMRQNQSIIFEFILLGFQEKPEVDVVLFILFLLLYASTLVGNFLILAVICSNSTLHSPMYFFIANFSSLEVLLTSSVIPKILVSICTTYKAISYLGCLLQSFFYFSFGSTELLIMAIMSIDRYIAICKPLQYSTIMNHYMCACLGISCWCTGFILILLPAILMFQMKFCNSNIINHFFCDSKPLLRLSCTDSSIIATINFVISTVIVLSSLMTVLFTYIHIIVTIVRMSSVTGRQKSFSTCVSHLMLVALAYGGTIFIYVVPNQRYALDKNKSVAVLNIFVTPVISPFIFTLRNKNFS
ncbi:olfactory receptor 6M1-like, partial [Pelobates cultripes]